MAAERNLPTKLNIRSRTKLVLGAVATLALFLASGLISYLNTRSLNHNAQLIAQTHEILGALNDLMSMAKDAETGQRGFVITGDEKYLAPYSDALLRIDSRLADLDRFMVDSRDQESHVAPLRAALESKLRELAESIELRRNQGFEAAKTMVITDRGKAAMDAIRSEIQEMLAAERQRRTERLASMDRAFSIAVSSGILTGLLGVVLSIIVAIFARRAMLTRQLQDWLNDGQIGLSKVMVGDQRLEPLGENVLRFLSEYLNAQAAAFFTRDGSEFHRVATYGVPSNGGAPEHFGLRDGLLGQACRDVRTFIVRNVPEGYLTVGSAFGQARPRHLLIAPLQADGVVNAVVEFGFLNEIDEQILEFFGRVAGAVGSAVRAANDRARLQNLLEETQRQAEELQAQGEELRVSNEELAEQSRSLKESQNRLELQQTELEATNQQLEEQTQLLETERDDLNRTRAMLQQQARELEQASRYKSEFLANMSHELRTPLNSSLILAKLLADNTDKNLTAEQVRYAETILSSGNDLLTLINDILDLSKIEAGHMEMHAESVRLERLAEDMTRTFQPMADQKRLAFRIRILPGCPETLMTDRQRLEQVLKNLLSNAMKFTDQGEVAVNISPSSGNRISFAVTDTGIGIPREQHQAVFDAFRQADGTTNRKYGGTGLGLSISRELARRLGGDIALISEPGQGSTFVVTLPETFDPTTASSRSVASPQTVINQPLRAPFAALKPSLADETDRAVADLLSASAAGVDDDRARLTGGRRVILIVEDDVQFAKILYDLGHELSFQCLIATSAEQALALAAHFLPSAVVLDVGLPDHSGLSVLDRLKHDGRTRHIPVHVISGSDYSQAALEMGAVGYILKPVKRDELVEALRNLETRLSQQLHRVLLVEDDPVQLDSLQKLLGTQEVQTVGAGNAAECLKQLKDSTFDCMVLDLSLPDASGYSLLETLSRGDEYAFPPVIVYTGRDLSIDEEQKLRKYSRSIIIKGAKSPERLLDEVTLFLHQVVSKLPPEHQRMLEKARSRDAIIEDRRILIVEDDVRNVFAVSSILESQGAVLEIARNGREAIDILGRINGDPKKKIDLVLMDVMMPEMDGIAATIEIRKHAEWKKIPIIMLTAKAMSDDQERCLAAGASDYMSKPLDVEKLLSLVRVWMPR